MSATEIWLLVGAIAASLATGGHLASPPLHVRIPNALAAAAIACIAFGLVMAFP